MIKLRMVSMEQVHGNRVTVAKKQDDGKTIKNCDGLITNSIDVELCIRVADCLPIAIFDQKVESLGVVHAGWRGLDKGIIGNAIGLMSKEFGSRPENLNVFIGPHICQKDYEVRNDVSSKFSKYPKSLFKKGDRIFLDLSGIARQQFVDLGVKDNNIQVDKACTFEDKTLYSYRRDQSVGRNLYLFSLNI